MQRIAPYLLAALFAACLPQFSQAQVVEIWGDFQPNLHGRALRREPLRTYAFDIFALSETLATSDPDGILTAVVLDRRVVEGLDAYLAAHRQLPIGTAWVTRRVVAGRTVFEYFDSGRDLRIAFSAERPSPGVLAVVDRTYARDPRWRREVGDHYRANYVIRIHEAENFIDRERREIDFEEALTAASILGDREQWLWGIRDGQGLLAGVPGIIALNAPPAPGEYRAWTVNQDRMRVFMSRLRLMHGSFDRSLFYETINSMRLTKNLEPMLPEEFIVRGAGDTREFAFFYFDILTRAGYDCRILAVKRHVDDPDLQFITIYRRGERDMWSALSARDIFQNKASDYTRLPAIVMGGPAVFILVDPWDFFDDRRLEFPALGSSARWRESRP